METTQYNITSTVLFGFLLMLICGLAYADAWQFLTPKGRITCNSFASYSDIQDYFSHHQGSGFDANHDGIPCNDRKN